MRRVGLVVCLAVVALALVPSRSLRADSDTPAALIGQKVANVTLTGSDNKSLAWHDAAKDRAAVVIVILSFECPVSRSYTAILGDLAKTYAPKKVTFIAVCPAEDDPAVLARQVEEFPLGFPVYRDDRLHAITALRARAMPEAFVLDRDFVLRYRGRIDDSFSDRFKKNAKTGKHDLRDALEAVLAGKPVAEAVTEPIGCPVPRPRSVSQDPAAKVTYHRDVLPILQKHCQSCHRPGEVGPFSLLTYKQAVNWAGDIKDYTQKRRMPPWKPTEGREFVGERKLSDKEIATLAAWVDGGTPEGDPKDAPPPRKFSDGWQLGEPDLVLTPEEPMTIGPSGGDLFRCFVLPTNLKEDRFVTAFELRPGNPRVLHHTLHFLDATGRGRKLERAEQERKKRDDEQDRGPGYTFMMGPGFFPTNGDIGGWAPGITPYRLPEGVGFWVPKGSDVVLQAHYHRTGRVEKDRLQLGLHFAKTPVERAMQQLVIPGNLLTIPPGEANYKVTGSIWLAQDATLHSVTPHMHLLGKTIKVTMTPPGGTATTLIGISDWDFNWQETYFFKEPVQARAGTRLQVEAVYDNSAKNPNNPNNPPIWVRVGEQTENEMCFVFFGSTSDDGRSIGFRLSPDSFVIRRPLLLPKLGPGTK
jgi:mono/diheme cytochrome c family protein